MKEWPAKLLIAFVSACSAGAVILLGREWAKDKEDRQQGKERAR